MMKNKAKYIIATSIIIIFTLFLGKYLVTDFNITDTTNNYNEDLNKEDSLVDVSKISNDDLKIYFIDVGQADCTLIEQNGKFMLIDAGNNDDGNLVVNFLKQKGVSKLDYVIGTHAHEDHIGGLDNVIQNFDEEKIFFPKTTSTTKTFEDFVKAVKAKNKKLYAVLTYSIVLFLHLQILHLKFLLQMLIIMKMQIITQL